MADSILADAELSGIYRIRNLENGKFYIGSAKCFRARWNSHRAMLAGGKHHSRHLQSSWTRHGASSFVFEIVELCDHGSLLVREQAWLDSCKPAFNVCRTAGNTLGRECSASTRRKIGASKVGKKMPTRSIEYCERISAAHSGRAKPPHVIQALQAGRAGRVYTEEQRERISASLKAAYSEGRHLREKSELHKQRIGRKFATLTDSEVREIRRLRAAGVTGRSLAKTYRSNPGTISEICSGKRYRWVS